MILATAFAIASAACTAYGLKIMLSEPKRHFYIFWFVLAAIFISPAALRLLGIWDTIPIICHWTVAMALLVFAIFELGFGIAIGRHFSDEAVPGLNCIIVLGARTFDGDPGRTFRNRLDIAHSYLTDNPHVYCIVCGGQDPNESGTEAAAGHNYLSTHGINSNRILLEERSHSTAQNMSFAGALIDPSHDAVGIVTSNFHVARALALARKNGFLHASGIAAGSLERFPLNNIVRESFAWFKDILLDNA